MAIDFSEVNESLDGIPDAVIEIYQQAALIECPNHHVCATLVNNGEDVGFQNICCDVLKDLLVDEINRNTALL